MKRDERHKATWRMCKVLHAIKRAKQRYGITVGANTIDDIGQRIRDGDCTLVEKRTNTISVFDVVVVDEVKGNVLCRVVYSSTWKFPITFLPKPTGGSCGETQGEYVRDLRKRIDGGS